MIHIHGDPGDWRYRAAQTWRDHITRAWPEVRVEPADAIHIVAGPRLPGMFGELVLDLVVLGALSRPRVITHSGRSDVEPVRLKSFSLVMTVKRCAAADVRGRWDHVGVVHHPSGHWSDTLRQSRAHVWALRPVLAGLPSQAPPERRTLQIRDLIWFPELSFRDLARLDDRAFVRDWLLRRSLDRAEDWSMVTGRLWPGAPRLPYLPIEDVVSGVDAGQLPRAVSALCARPEGTLDELAVLAQVRQEARRGADGPEPCLWFQPEPYDGKYLLARALRRYESSGERVLLVLAGPAQHDIHRLRGLCQLLQVEDMYAPRSIGVAGLRDFVYQMLGGLNDDTSPAADYYDPYDELPSAIQTLVRHPETAREIRAQYDALWWDHVYVAGADAAPAAELELLTRIYGG